jgi:hypothetical protein
MMPPAPMIGSTTTAAGAPLEARSMSSIACSKQRRSQPRQANGQRRG